MNQSIQRFLSGINDGLDLYTENPHARTLPVARAKTTVVSGKAALYCLIVAIWGAIIVGFGMAALIG